MIKKKWYVLKTLTGHESKVKSYIENNIKKFNYQEYIGRIIVPMEKIIQIKNGKRFQKEKAYYNGYIMIELSIDIEIIYFIKKIPGVINFLCEEKRGSPLPMREYEVDKLLGNTTSESIDNISINIPFILGESVKVIDGPFNGFNGTIEKIHKEKKKVELSVLIFGRKTPLELNFTQIEKF